MNSIGTISKVFPHKIVIEVPLIERLTFNYEGYHYRNEGINSYISIEKSYNERFIYQITSLYENEKPFSSENVDSKFRITSSFEAIPVGIISKQKFVFGLSHIPYDW